MTKQELSEGRHLLGTLRLLHRLSHLFSGQHHPDHNVLQYTYKSCKTPEDNEYPRKSIYEI